VAAGGIEAACSPRGDFFGLATPDGLTSRRIRYIKRRHACDDAVERLGRVKVPSESAPVFTIRHGTPVEPSNFDRSFNRRIALAGVTKIAITMEIYTEVPSASTREALRKLGQWLDDAPST